MSSLDPNGRITRRTALGAIAAPVAFAAFGSRVLAQAAPTATPPVVPPMAVDATAYSVFMEDPSIEGRVKCVGSSAVGLLLEKMRVEFSEDQPRIDISVVSSGSGTAAAALASGEAMLAPMSRAMRASEIEEVEKRRKGKVDFIDFALDAIAVSVHFRNPTTRMTMRDLDRVFGRERRRGGAPAARWSDLGVSGDLGAKTIALHGMGPQSGSNGLVQEVVLQGGPFRTAVIEEPVSSSVVQAVATDEAAIGYSSVAFESERVRRLSIEAIDGSGFVEPTPEHIRSGRYPLCRAMRIYFVREAVAKSPAARKVLEFAVSEDGQQVVEQLLMMRVPAENANRSFERLTALGRG